MPDFSQIFILTDLDGTLLGSDATVSEQNRAAARYFIAHGGRFSFATGRSRAGAQHFADIPVNAPAVLCNGSYGYDFVAGKPVYTWPVDRAPTLALIDAVSAAFPDCGIEIICDDGPWVVQNSPLVERHLGYTRTPCRLVAPTQVPEPWISLGLLIDPGRMAALKDYASQHFGRDFFIQQSMPHFLEIQRPGADKAAGALELCRQLGLPREGLYVVGDGTNDVELLSVSPNAFAPQNACEAVLALSPTLLPHHDAHVLPALIAHLTAMHP